VWCEAVGWTQRHRAPPLHPGASAVKNRARAGISIYDGTVQRRFVVRLDISSRVSAFMGQNLRLGLYAPRSATSPLSASKIIKD
jgi:hypothetical protein